MKQWLSAMILVLGAGVAWAQGEEPGAGPVSPPVSREARGAEFLTRIRVADPDYRLILMACLKERELNLLLSRYATARDVPILVKGLLEQLRQQFPGEDLSVVAFRPIVPLKEAATAKLQGTTGAITYTESPSAER